MFHLTAVLFLLLVQNLYLRQIKAVSKRQYNINAGYFSKVINFGRISVYSTSQSLSSKDIGVTNYHLIHTAIARNQHHGA